MAGRRLSMSQIIAGAVPFLLVLLLLPVAPTIERIVHTDFVHPSTTTSTTHPSSQSTHTVASDHGLTSTTTTTDPAAPLKTGTAPTVGRSAGTTTSTSTTTTSTTTTTTTTTTDPPATDSGTLTTDNQEVSTPVTANSNWIMSPESGAAVEWSLVCGSSVTPEDGESVTIEWPDTNCDLVVRSVISTPVTWKLTEY